MKITYNFEKAILKTIDHIMDEYEIPTIYGGILNQLESIWFVLVSEHTSNIWFVSITKPSGKKHLQLKAIEISSVLLIPFGMYVLENDSDACGALYTYLEKQDADISKTITNFTEIDYRLNALLKEIEKRSGTEFEILDLRNVEYWRDWAAEHNRDFLHEFMLLDRASEYFANEVDDDFPF